MQRLRQHVNSMARQELNSSPPEGKIDIHERTKAYERALAKFEVDTIISPTNQIQILAFLRDCALGKTLKVRGRKKLGPGRCLKYLGILKYLSVTLGKDFDGVRQEDMERFVGDLQSNLLLSKKGRHFSDETKADILKAVKKFWKWKDGDNRAYPELVDWIDTTVGYKEIPALSREEVEIMVDRCAGLRDKALLMVLFDSGARAEEFLNVRLKQEHVFWSDTVGCYMMRIEFSKTKPRTISLPLSTRYLREWLEVHPQRNEPTAQLFPMTYDAMRMAVSRIGWRVLKKHVFPHLLRHSSATYYAKIIQNRFKFCYRYGWSMTSRMPDRYIDRGGMVEEETPVLVRGDEARRASKQNDALNEELVQLREGQAELTARHQAVVEELERLKSGKGMLAILENLAKRQEKTEEMLRELNKRGFDVILRESD